MSAELYWVDWSGPGRVAILARPRGGDGLEEDLRSCREAKIDVIVSMLAPEEVAEFGLEDEGPRSESLGMEYFSFPITDRGVPDSPDEALKLIRRLAGLVKSGKNVAFHCRAGVGRSPLMACLVLARLGKSPDEAIELLSTARGWDVPEMPEQKDWLRTAAARL